MSRAAEAAGFIDEAHRARARYRNLPDDIAPTTVAEAYAAQAALCELWGARLGPVAGLKIATTTRVMQELMGIDHPCMGTIFAARVYASPATIAKSDFINVRVECELAVRLRRDLPEAGVAADAVIALLGPSPIGVDELIRQSGRPVRDVRCRARFRGGDSRCLTSCCASASR